MGALIEAAFVIFIGTGMCFLLIAPILMMGAASDQLTRIHNHECVDCGEKLGVWAVGVECYDCKSKHTPDNKPQD